MLQQIAHISAGEIHLHRAFEAAHVPTELTYYPGESPNNTETHVFHIPRNRLNAMKENLAWFDFWLLGKEDKELLPSERFASWEAMKASDSTLRAKRP